MSQCDGCLRRLPIKDGIHYIESQEEMVCTSNRYETAFSEFMRGLDDDREDVFLEVADRACDDQNAIIEESLDFTHGESLENCSPNTVISNHLEDEE